MPSPSAPEIQQEARLLLAQGLTPKEIASRLPVCADTIRRWRARDQEAATPGATADRGNVRPHALTPEDRARHAERFLSKVDKSGDCWLWTASLSGGGYGQFYVGSQKVPAHRWFYELSVAPVPDELHMDHLCRVRACVRPDHLEPVTPRENALRGVASNARKTHCLAGHPFDEENTYRDKRGHRGCRTCHREKSRVRMARIRAEQAAAVRPANGGA